MGVAEKLEMFISLDPSQGVAGLERFSKSAEDNVKKSESAMSRVGAAAMKLGVAGIGVGGFLTQMAAGDIEAANQLKAAIGQVGQAQGDYQERIDATIKAQVRFGHTDEEVSKALTTLTLSYNDTGKALDEMQLVTDLAARKHISLTDAASLVARAHGGAGKMFKEFGIVVQQNTDGTKDYDGALVELAGKLKGQAAASADTFTGKLAAIRAEIENQVSEFGQKYGPAIMASSAAITAFGGVVSGASSLLGKFRAARLADAAAAETEAAASATSKLAIAGVAGVAAIGALALIHYGQAQEKTKLDSEELGKITKLSGDQMIQTMDAIAAQSKGPFADMFKNALQGLVEQGDAGIGVLQRYKEHLVATGQDTSQVDAALKSAAEAQANLNTNTDQGTAAQDRSAAAVKANAAALKDLHDEIHASADPLFAMIKALADNKKAQEDATAAQKDGKKSAEEKAAADLHVAETALAVHDASLTLAAGVQAGTVSVSAAQVQLATWVSQGLLTQGQANEVATAFGVVAGKADELDGRNVNMTVTTTFKSIGDLGVAASKDFHGVGAASGFQGWVDRPTPFLVAEGGESEYVSVTPKSKMGGGGGSPNSAMGGNSTTIYIDARGAQQGAGRGIVDALVAHSRSNNAPVALKEWIAS